MKNQPALADLFKQMTGHTIHIPKIPDTNTNPQGYQPAKVKKYRWME